MTKEEIHNIYLHISGKAEGIAEVAGSADFPVMFAEAILAYSKPVTCGYDETTGNCTNNPCGYLIPPTREWIGLTEEQFLNAAKLAEAGNYMVAFQRIQQWLKETNA